MPPPAPIWEDEILVNQAGGLCFCLDAKLAGESFCGPCFALLPPGIRTALANVIGQAYITVFTDACEMLLGRRFAVHRGARSHPQHEPGDQRPPQIHPPHPLHPIGDDDDGFPPAGPPL